MRRYLAKATSPGNIWEGQIIIEAINLCEAQDIFFDWLREQEVYRHMWRINLALEELRKGEYETIGCE